MSKKFTIKIRVSPSVFFFFNCSVLQEHWRIIFTSAASTFKTICTLCLRSSPFFFSWIYFAASSACSGTCAWFIASVFNELCIKVGLSSEKCGKQMRPFLYHLFMQKRIYKLLDRLSEKNYQVLGLPDSRIPIHNPRVSTLQILGFGILGRTCKR